MGIFKRIKEFFTPVRTEQYNIRQQVETDMRANELAAAKAAHPAGKGRAQKTYVPPTTRPNTGSSRPARTRDTGQDYDYTSGAVISSGESDYSSPSWESPSSSSDYSSPSSSSYGSSGSSSSDSGSSGGFGGGGSD